MELVLEVRSCHLVEAEERVWEEVEVWEVRSCHLGV